MQIVHFKWNLNEIRIFVNNRFVFEAKYFSALFSNPLQPNILITIFVNRKLYKVLITFNLLYIIVLKLNNIKESTTLNIISEKYNIPNFYSILK